MRLAALCIVLAAFHPYLYAQSATQAQDPGFEAASIRPSDLKPACFSNLPPGSTHYALTCVSLRELIAMAFQVHPDFVEGGGSPLSTYYDLRAVTPGGMPWTNDSVRPMLRRFLEERFRLSVHRGTKQISGYSLTVAKGGPKLEPSDVDVSTQGHKAGEPFHTYIMVGRIHSPGANMDVLASLLGSPAHAEVRDHTGIHGAYKIDLHYAQEGSTDLQWPDLFTAVTEQLGLKLEADKITIQTVIVDHVEDSPLAN